MQHLQFLSAQIASQQIPEEVQMQLQEVQGQMQQMSPQEAQQVQQQIQMTLDQFSSPIMAQLTSEFLQSIGQGQGGDPLVEIRKTELDLKDKEIDIESPILPTSLLRNLIKCLVNIASSSFLDFLCEALNGSHPSLDMSSKTVEVEMKVYLLDTFGDC